MIDGLRVGAKQFATPQRDIFHPPKLIQRPFDLTSVLIADSPKGLQNTLLKITALDMCQKGNPNLAFQSDSIICPFSWVGPAQFQ